MRINKSPLINMLVDKNTANNTIDGVHEAQLLDDVTVNVLL